MTSAIRRFSVERDAGGKLFIISYLRRRQRHMLEPLRDKTIALGVTGGIAAYKSVELLRLLTKAGARVRVIMTANAQWFVGPGTFQALSGLPVCTSVFEEGDASIRHIDWARETELAVIAPATANTIGKLANGIALLEDRGADRQARKGLKGAGAHEPLGVGRHDHPHLRTGLGQQPQELNALVSRDTAGDAQGDGLVFNGRVHTRLSALIVGKSTHLNLQACAGMRLLVHKAAAHSVCHRGYGDFDVSVVRFLFDVDDRHPVGFLEHENRTGGFRR